MKTLRLLLILVFITACKSVDVASNDSSFKKLTAKKVIKNHETNFFAAKTLDARLRVSFSDNRSGQRKRQSLTVRLRIQKDSVIWIKGSKVVSAFRAKITPSSFSYYSPITKEYFTGDYTFLKELLGIEVTFNQLQNLFFGQSVLDIADEKFQYSKESKSHKLTPKKQNDLFSAFFYFYPKNFRLKKLFIEDTSGKTLRIDYNSYIKKSNEYFPKRIVINSTNGDYYTFLDMDVKSVEFNLALTIPYSIPVGYKELKIKK